MTKEELRNILAELLIEKEIKETKVYRKALLELDGIYYTCTDWAGYTRGTDHNIFTNDNNKQALSEIATIIIPETKTYLSNTTDKILEENNFKRIPLT